MIYSNPEFIFLFLFVYLGYACASNQKLKHFLLCLSSLVFYAWGGLLDTGIFLLILAVAWLSAFYADKYPHKKNGILTFGILVLALHLLIWKYVPWLFRELQELVPTLRVYQLELPLPLGISFFTLQGVAYLIDFRRGLVPLMTLKDFFLFKSFFPQLVAGPIVRAQELHPQLTHLKNASFALVAEGMPLFVAGLFKKLAIADRMAPYIDAVFAHPENYSQSSLVLAILGYTVQIWADFSGYTDMGRGIAKMFGIALPENFLSPYLAMSPSEFWKRWHVTLSQWIRDYIYIPLVKTYGGNFLRLAFLVILTMSISGLWHGANWTFLIWGWYHGALLVIERVFERFNIKSPSKVFTWATMFSLTVFGWLIFRSTSLTHFTLFLSSLWKGQGTEQIASTRHILFSLAFCLTYQAVLYFDLKQRDYCLFTGRLSRLRESVNNWLVAFSLGLASAAVAWTALVFAARQSVRAFIYFQF